MTLRPAAGWDPPELPDPLSGFVSAVAGTWKILARPGRLEIARSFLEPFTVEEILTLMVKAPGETGAEGAWAGDPGAVRQGPRGRGGVLEVDCGDGTTLILKALRRGGLPARLRGGYYGGSRLLAEMAILEEAWKRGVPTAAPAFGAVGLGRDGRAVGLLATESLAGAIRLGAIIDRSPLPVADLLPAARRSGDRRNDAGAPRPEDPRRAALRAAGGAVRRAHDLGLAHSDLNIGNILLRRGLHGWEAALIDVGLSDLGGPLEPGRRAANLVRLLRSAEKHLGAHPGQARYAVAFLIGYLGEGPDPHRRRRRELLTAVRRRLPVMRLHRLGWRLLGKG
jgi:hypothetical protein